MKEGDVHASAGLSCADCHGGDPTLGVETGTKADAMDRKRGYVGRPRGADVARMCGRCHADIELMRRHNPRTPTDQLAHWLTSAHGKRAAAGDEKAATCASCHGAHGVRRVKDPASPVHPMRVVETCARCHPDELDRYQRSAHGRLRLAQRDPGAPACNTCHGNHGAVPPGFSAVTHVCGSCHGTQAELFESGGHARSFARNKIPPCTSCHGNHEIPTPEDRMLAVGEGELCSRCHPPGGACDRAALAMSDGIRILGRDIALAERKVADADRAGMDVRRAQFDLAAARDALVRTRVMVHAFDPDRFAETVKEGRAAAATVATAGEAALAEHRFRRVGLFIAAAVLLLFAGLLALKAWRLERGG
jgi:predicted CXXCH cytochrome family protein